MTTTMVAWLSKEKVCGLNVLLQIRSGQPACLLLCNQIVSHYRDYAMIMLRHEHVTLHHLDTRSLKESLEPHAATLSQGGTIDDP